MLKKELKDARYFGSDYNKFVNLECPKEMTIINRDILAYKRTKGILRLGESKYFNENTGESQAELLSLIAHMYRFLQFCVKSGYMNFPVCQKCPPIREIEYVLIRGNYPYENGVIIQDYFTKREIEISKEDLKRFSTFNLTLRDLLKNNAQKIH